MHIPQGHYLVMVFEAKEDVGTDDLYDDAMAERFTAADLKFRHAYKAERHVHSDRVAVVCESAGSVGSGARGPVLAVVDEHMLPVALQDYRGRSVTITTRSINDWPDGGVG